MHGKQSSELLDFYDRKRHQLMAVVQQLRADRVALHEVVVFLLERADCCLGAHVWEALKGKPAVKPTACIVVLTGDVARELSGAPRSLMDNLDGAAPGMPLVVVTTHGHFAVLRHPVPVASANIGSNRRRGLPVFISSDVLEPKPAASPVAERLRLLERALVPAAALHQEALRGDLDLTCLVLVMVDATDNAVWSRYISIAPGDHQPLPVGLAVQLLDNVTAFALANATPQATAHMELPRDGSSCRILVGTAGGWHAGDAQWIPGVGLSTC